MKGYKNWASSKGIKWEFSAPYTPEQNGVAERANRTLIEGARSMLLGAGVNKNLWPYAIRTKCYLLNRTGTKANLESKTPLEKFYNKIPEIKHIRIFGALGYATTPQAKKKLDPRGEKVRMLGYSEEHKAYIVDFIWKEQDRRFKELSI